MDARVVWTSCEQTAVVPHRHMHPQVGRVVRRSGAGWLGEALFGAGHGSVGCGEVSGSAQLRQLYASSVGASARPCLLRLSREQTLSCAHLDIACGRGAVGASSSAPPPV